MREWITYEWRKFSDEVLQSSSLGSETELFLQIVGLPEIEIYDALRFKPFYEESGLEATTNHAYFPLGILFDSTLYLRIATGEVVLNYPEGIYSSEFVNSDISSFVLCLEAYAYLILNTLGKDENEIISKRLDVLFEARLQGIDSKALLKEHFWAGILKDLRNHFGRSIW